MRRIDIINFVEALRNPHNHLRTLKDVRLLTDNRSVPIMFSGNRSVVFKAAYKERIVAIKCYENNSEQFVTGLIESCQYFSTLNSPLVNKSEIYPQELVIYDELNGEHIELTVEMYDWIDGRTIGYELCEAAYLNDQPRLNFIIDGFIKTAIKLLESNFAHGDIKADNIIITTEGKFLLIDLNNAYIPTFHYSPSREIGTNGFRHPKRQSSYYNKRIDDYPIVVMLATILVAQHSPFTFFKHYDGEFSIFSPEEIIAGKSDSFFDAENLFKENIILSQLISLQKSKIPSIPDLKWWLEKIVQQRYTNPENGTQIFFDTIHNKYGISNQTGSITYPPIFSDANELHNGSLSVKLNNLWGFIDLNGNKQTDFIYEDIRNFSEDRVAVKKMGKYGFLDTFFTSISDFIFDDVNNFSEGYAVVKIANKYGYIDLNGNQVTPIIYDFAHNVKQNQAKIRIDNTTSLLKIK